MSHEVAEQSQRFGGHWTKQKLEILKAYLETYTTLMKRQGFNLYYVDAFAGSGSVEIATDIDKREFLEGSVHIALEVDNRPFDRLLFVEKDPNNVASLKQVIREHSPSDAARVLEGDANDVLPTFCSRMRWDDRAVVFLDPFGAQVNWQTVKSIGRSKKCDTWILFPSGYIRRFLIPRRGALRTEADRQALIRVFGDDPSLEIQRPVRQLSLFDPPGEVETDAGTDAIVAAYQNRLRQEFARVAEASRTLRNSNNAAMYELMFAAANPKGADKAVEIANHILERF